METQEVNELAEKFSDLGQLVTVRADTWKEVLGEAYAREHPEVPVFLSGDDLKALQEKRGLEHGRLGDLVERFLSDERVLSDASPAVARIKEAYRLILSGYRGDLPKLLDERLRAGATKPEALKSAAILALNLWSLDPRADPDAWGLWLMAGGACLRLTQHARAREYLETAVRLNPRSAEALNELGLVHAVEARYPEAEDCFKRALYLAPEDARTLAHLGALCLQAGRGREARGYLGKARDIDPGDERVKQLWETASKIKE